MSGTYVTDITHFLNDEGELVATLPTEARQLASFLVLLIDEASQACPAEGHDSRVRCRMESCQGSILVSLPSADEEVTWNCPECGHNGVIRNWQGTKWDGSKEQAR